MRRTIRIDEHGHVRMEGNPQEEVWMTLAEIADLFNLPCRHRRQEIKAIRKTGVLVDYEACKDISARRTAVPWTSTTGTSSSPWPIV